MKKTYKKLGAVFRAPIVQQSSVLIVIGMVMYVGLYNPRAGLAAAKAPEASARAAPGSKPGDLNGDNMVNALDLSMYLSSQNHGDAASWNSAHNNLALETQTATIMKQWTWQTYV